MQVGGCLGHYDSRPRVEGRKLMYLASSAEVQVRQVAYGHLRLGAAADEASVLGWRGDRGGCAGKAAMWEFGWSLHGCFQVRCWMRCGIVAGYSGFR